MANIISSFFSSASFKLKNSATGNTAAGDALKVMSVNIKLSSTPMRHMKEDGSTVIDARIIQPASIKLEVLCETLAAFSKLNEVAKDRSSFYSVTSKGITLNNVMIEDQQVSQNPEFLSAIPVRLSMKQVLIQNSTPIIFAKSSDASLISKGMSLVSSIQTSASDLFSSITSKI